jgi:peptide/nickel transport system substrate-binding protein
MRKPSIWLLAGATALVVGLIVGPAANAKPERQSAGTIVIGHDQEPVTLNNYLTEGNSATTSLVTNLILGSGMVYNQNAKFVPFLLAQSPKIVKENPLTVTFSYSPKAVWSDGRQVTGADFKATYNTIMNPKWDITSREGWQDLQLINATGKNVTMIFKKGKSYAGWDTMVATSPMPAHKVAGVDFNQWGRDGFDISSGPFKFTSWQRGTQIVLSKNAAFKIRPAKIDRIVNRYIPSTPSMFQALTSNELQVIAPQAQLQIVDIQKNSKFKVQSGPGYFWEHMDIQFGPKANPAIRQKYVRQALVQGINRAQIRQALYVAPGLVKSAKDLPVLQSHLFKPFETAYYKENWAVWKFNQANVIKLLKSKGCTGGPSKPAANNSNIWSCPNVGKLSFRFTTTSGNQLRALTFEIAQKQLKSVGIELVPRFGPSGTVFGQILPSGDWDIFMFTWLGGPTTGATSFGLYGCGGDQNYMNYCNKKASDLLNKAQFTPDPSKRAGLLNTAEKIMVQDVMSIPMYVRPNYTINSVKVKGPVLNPTQQGVTWNAETWTISA